MTSLLTLNTEVRKGLISQSWFEEMEQVSIQASLHPLSSCQNEDTSKLVPTPAWMLQNTENLLRCTNCVSDTKT